MGRQRVVVIGGGISGLTVAHRLSELRREQGIPAEITVLEGRGRFGGLIETQRRDGFLLEAGPDSFLSEHPWVIDLCRRLGVAGDIIETRGEHRRSFILRKGRLVPVPKGLYLIAPDRMSTLWKTPLVSWAGKLRMACEPFIPARTGDADETVGSFVRRRLGREALERLGQPMVGGIYTADPDRLSLLATLPRFREMERRHGSLLNGMRARARDAGQATQAASGPRYSLFLSMRDGLSTIVEALVRSMPDVDLRPSAPVDRIARGTSWKVVLTDGTILDADLLCLALPAGSAARLLRGCATDLSRELSTIPYESVATVNVGFRREDIPHSLDGFGVVMPAVERRGLVGCTFSSVKFSRRAPEGSSLLRAFVGGAMHRGMFELDDAAMERMVLDELRQTLGIRATPRFVSIHRFPQAMPQYHLGHLDRLESIDRWSRRYPGLHLTGNGYRGIGIPDCIRQAELTAERIAAAVGDGSAFPPLDGVRLKPDPQEPSPKFDHVLLIGFGGPTKPDEVAPFLERKTRGFNIPAARLQEVMHHYEVLGGRSRYNEDTFALVKKLEANLQERGVTLPVIVGMQHWHPYLNDAMEAIRRRGLNRGIGVVLAPHRSEASFDRYLRGVESAKRDALAHHVRYDYLPAWHEHPLFIEAQADLTGSSLDAVPPADRGATHLLFSAHSIPVEMAESCRYAQEIESSSRGVAERLNHDRWSVAYQSRSGNPRQPWLEPDVESAVREIKARGGRHVVVVPIGFLCENVEVLFDLDIEVRREAGRIGLGFSRASTVRDHPRFVEMFSRLICDRLLAGVPDAAGARTNGVPAG